MPFVLCIRKHIQNIIGVAVDVPTFKSLPSHARRILGDDPHYLAFTRVLIGVLEHLHLQDAVSIICDDEQSTAWPMYLLYRKVKLAFSDVHARLRSISFADDELFYALQAADLVASLVRMEARNIFHDELYDYQPLFKAFTMPETTDALWNFGTCFADREKLSATARDYAELQKKYPGEDLRLLEVKSITSPTP